ncbi:hypothetical protein IFM89_028169 [Coptis chinensis]|uniref:Uncharacterized protein n=1 Tax=Coptis chinensis TaxID=261450 RepID=A0A835I0H7_9MAGN|nr:hypothetical protein IFM89_028169 [Coptis chinensis]
MVSLWTFQKHPLHINGYNDIPSFPLCTSKPKIRSVRRSEDAEVYLGESMGVAKTGLWLIDLNQCFYLTYLCPAVQREALFHMGVAGHTDSVLMKLVKLHTFGIRLMQLWWGFLRLVFVTKLMEGQNVVMFHELPWECVLEEAWQVGSQFTTIVLPYHFEGNAPLFFRMVCIRYWDLPHRPLLWEIGKGNRTKMLQL